MNKYLREFLLKSGVPMLAELGAKDLKRKHAKRHAAHQADVHAKLYGEGATIEIKNGPFEGMRYLNETVWGSITPKWIGSYEHELWPVVDEILATAYRHVIDVGCAEGYYAVGFARLVPEATVFAFDLDDVSRNQAKRLWELNGSPGDLKFGRWCDHKTLSAIGGGGTLVFCDIEGGEMALLDPLQCPVLKQADVLVEVHGTGKTPMARNADTLAARFAATHRVNRIDTTGAIPALAGVDALNADELAKACNEGRHYPQTWLWMKAGK